MNSRLESVKAKLRNSDTYGDECVCLEKSIMEIIKTLDTSEEAIQVFAFALMEAPSDFDYYSAEQPFKKSRD